MFTQPNAMDNFSTERVSKQNTEKWELRQLIAQYADELLKRAIDRGILPTEIDFDETSENPHREKLNSLMPTPDILLEGIMMLYTSDMERANARMKQYFEKVQSVPDLNKQLKMCYAMLRVMNGATSSAGFLPMYTSEYWGSSAV